MCVYIYIYLYCMHFDIKFYNRLSVLSSKIKLLKFVAHQKCSKIFHGPSIYV